ncbi:phage tail protein, partial [Phenylobacterium sp.]|uniref:phage tail protein n=1 Tax=Phenylobacterium sp. TaxID=1871053 RepID=UPI0025DAF60C
GLWGAVEGYVISALESPRTSIDVLARHFGFDAVESEGKLRFVKRGRAPVLSVTPDGMVASGRGPGNDGTGEPQEIVRAQESELPQALKWTIARADEDYDAAIVEARRITVDSTRIAAEAFAIAVPPEEAERRCRRALVEAWVGRETATFRLPPSRLALDPCDVVGLGIDGRTLQMRIAQTADADARTLETVRQDREAYDLPPGEPRLASIARPVVFGQPDIAFMDLPQLREDVPAHRPWLAADAAPWPGALGVYRSPALDSFAFLTGVDGRARMGRLASGLFPGPVSIFDLGNSVLVDLAYGTLASVTDLDVLGGANAFAIESAPGTWEILQAATAELVAPGRYRLSRLLRGQRGTEYAMGNPAPVGARIVALDDLIVPLPIAEAEIGLAWNWRVGPASRGVSDPTFTGKAFTPSGRGLLPFSPVNVEQPWRTGRVPGDLTIRWVRRSRDLSADAWEIGEPPLGETSEAWEVEIWHGATLKRTLSSSSTSALYSAAAQTADFGALLGPGQSFTVRIFQVSARLARGTPAIVTLFT